MATDTGLPEFLADLKAFETHMASSLETGSGAEKGDAFLRLAQKIIPLYDETRAFGALHPSEKKTHDKGVDLLSADLDGEPRLYAQAKYRIPTVEQLDSVVSKFQAYDHELLEPPDSLPLFPTDSGMPGAYAIATCSTLQNILPKYRKSALASVQFFEMLEEQRRIHIFDGPRLLRKFREVWKRTYVIPMDLALRSTAGWVTSGTVAIGVLPAATLIDLYNDHGDSIFFENIREYIGRESDVNKRIRGTIANEPDRLLERNNGVTFRAESFAPDPNDASVLQLKSGAIVNGCQTTMSIVECSRDLGPDSGKLYSDCFVQIKVVGVEDAWAVASAANYQNTVHRIDLELARWLRPQLVRRAAATEGVAIRHPGAAVAQPATTINSLLETFYSHEVRHDQVRFLFLGIFGAAPNDLFNNNYERIKHDVINAIYGSGPGEVQLLYTTLFQMAESTSRALEYCAEHFSDALLQPVFKRIHEASRPYYSAYMTLLALAAGTDINLGERILQTEEDVDRTRLFLSASRDLMTNKFERFEQCFAAVYTVVGQVALDISEEKDFAQVMNRRVREAGFTRLLQQAKLQLSLLDGPGGPAS